MTTLTVTVGLQTNKARALHVGEHQGQRAVVSIAQKPTGVSVDRTRASLTSTHPGKRTQSKMAIPLSPRLPDRARYGADNECYESRNPSPNHLRSH